MQVMIAAAAAATLSGSAVLFGAPSANAAVPLTAGQYCGTFQSGTANKTYFYKQAGTCHDVNIVYVHDPEASWDSYAGLYWNGKVWVLGARGFKRINNGNCDPNTDQNCVPITDLLAGTKFQILSASQAFAAVDLND
jgi:hypothetical protein